MIKRLILFLLLTAASAFAQTGTALIQYFPGVPSGACMIGRTLAMNQSTGELYFCRLGTWTVAAGLPATAPGDTIWGNNTVATSAPSFFTPGGDVSFSAGNFSVNQLHFGPTVLTLTNSGISTGNCLQVSGSTLIGGACGTGGGGGGLSGSGTANTISKFTGATALGDSLLTDDGTTLHYTGTGGIVAPSVNVIGGAFKLESVVGTLPNPPATGHNGLVSGPDGWYYSNNGATYVKLEPGGGSGVATSLNFSGTTIPLGASPTTGQFLTYDGTSIVSAPAGSGGAVTSVFGRTGAVTANTGDYNVSQVAGAAPIADAALTGSPTAPTVTPTSDSSTRLATTEFVHNAIAAGGGGTPQPVLPIERTYANCKNGTSGAVSNNYFNDVNIQPGDTVVVFSHSTVAGTPEAKDNASPATNDYTLGPTANSTTHYNRAWYSLASRSATSVHISVQGNSGTYFWGCVAIYKNVHSIANSNGNNQGGVNGTNFNASITTSAAGSRLITFMSTTNTSLTIGNVTPSPALGSGAIVALCENIATNAGQNVSCSGTLSTSAQRLITYMELVPGVAGPAAPSEFPKVVKYQDYSVSAAAMADTTLCSSTECQPGFYQLSWSLIALTDCSGTGGTIIPRVKFEDERTTARDHPLVRTAPYEFSFQPRVPPTPGPWDDGTLIMHITSGAVVLYIPSSQVVACSAGAVSGKLHVALERLY